MGGKVSSQKRRQGDGLDINNQDTYPLLSAFAEIFKSGHVCSSVFRFAMLLIPSHKSLEYVYQFS